MEKLLRYLISILIAVAFISGIDKPESVSVEDSVESLASDEIAYYTDFSASEINTDLFLPRQASTNVLRVQSTTKRTSNVHRNNFEFVNSGTQINLSAKHFVQKKSLISHIRFIKPALRLISFGKLII